MIFQRENKKKLHIYSIITVAIYLLVINFLKPESRSSLISTIFFLPLIIILLTSILQNKFSSKLLLSLHLSIFALIIVFFIASVTNKTFTISIEEGQTISSESLKKIGIKTLTLDDFAIELTEDRRGIKNYKSILIINQKDTICLKVNKPYRRKSTKILQKAYRKNYYFNIIINGSNNYLLPGDSLTIDDFTIVLRGFNQKRKKFELTINDSTYYMSKDRVYEVKPFYIMITPGFIKYTSILLISQNKARRILLAFAIIYLLTLTITFIRKR